MTIQRQQDIKCVASRIRKNLNNDNKGLPLSSMFWEDLQILLKLILEEKKDE